MAAFAVSASRQPLFDIDELDPGKAVEFYQHDMAWSNRMILGDSLVVMASLLDRERLGGKVQCVFMDRPTASSTAATSSHASVTGRSRTATTTRSPESPRARDDQAYRDTWELGVHSYLSYLRDRLATVHELLTESGSAFVQIGEENLHRVRILMDEVFGADNFVSQITFSTTSGAGSPGELKNLPATCNYMHLFSQAASGAASRVRDRRPLLAIHS